MYNDVCRASECIANLSDQLEGYAEEVASLMTSWRKSGRITEKSYSP